MSQPEKQPLNLPLDFDPASVADPDRKDSAAFLEGARQLLAQPGMTVEKLAADLYAIAGEQLPDFTPAEAECSLTPDEMEDKRLVTCIRGIGPPPRLKPVTKTGPTGLKVGRDQKIWFCKFMAEMPSPTLAAKLLGVSKRALYYARDKDADFKAAWEAAKDIGMSQIDDAITEEALGYGVRHHVTKDGDILTIPKERNEKILLAFLNLHNAERLNKHVVEHQGGGVIVVPQPMSPEEFEKHVFTQQQRHRDGQGGNVVEGSFSRVNGEEQLLQPKPDTEAPTIGGKVGIQTKSERASAQAIKLGREAAAEALTKPAMPRNMHRG